MRWDSQPLIWKTSPWHLVTFWIQNVSQFSNPWLCQLFSQYFTFLSLLYSSGFSSNISIPVDQHDEKEQSIVKVVVADPVNLWVHIVVAGGVAPNLSTSPSTGCWRRLDGGTVEGYHRHHPPLHRPKHQADRRSHLRQKRRTQRLDGAEVQRSDLPLYISQRKSLKAQFEM